MKDNPVLQAIHSRRSIRRYKDKPLTEEQIGALVDAALMSPSSLNRQPWHLTVVTDTALIAQWETAIIEHFVEIGNEETVAHNKARGNKIFYDAPAVFLITSAPATGIDVGIMAQSLTIAAKGMGLDSVILGFPRVAFEPRYHQKWQKKLGFPEGHEYGISVAVGYGNMPGNDRTPDYTKVSYLK